METIGDRILKVIEDSGVKKTQFAESINISQSFVTYITQGKKIPSDRTISDICRVYNVNEAWLRTGEGEPYRPLSRDEALAAFLGDVLRGETPDFRRRLLAALSKLTTEQWAVLETVANRLVEESLAEQAAAPPEGEKKEAGP